MIRRYDISGVSVLMEVTSFTSVCCHAWSLCHARRPQQLCEVTNTQYVEETTQIDLETNYDILRCVFVTSKTERSQQSDRRLIHLPGSLYSGGFLLFVFAYYTQDILLSLVREPYLHEKGIRFQRGNFVHNKFMWDFHSFPDTYMCVVLLRAVLNLSTTRF